MPVDAIGIGRSALDVEWQRLQIIAQNLANQNTSRIAGGGTYRPLRVISGPAGDFSRMITAGQPVATPQGVRVISIEADGGNVRRIYDPGHPDAGADGFVAYPGVDLASEMTLLSKTARVYESNLTLISLAQQMNMRALELGKR
ncbi:flagellar basal body rod protein FlgC [Sphingomonas colocasiae]|uniref:Flagellar basal-body rod protein FlgC n=1 Tax=Sphingomonas colocasiae TaxID=1848973 RepID=A0ABS7PZY3_9SPHN|nr:flagellar basal body rod protein FlgC [Sphingomonas colocasiae]MBY8825554.1 flagellar basal body rod protein FlgC [Sphingomonas colocasiae]